MAIAKTSLSGIVKEFDQVTKALKALKGDATPQERKLLDAKIKSLNGLKAECERHCPKGSHSLNANPLVKPSRKSKK